MSASPIEREATNALRELAQATPPATMIVRVRDLSRSRGPLVAVAAGCVAHTRVLFELALIHVEGEPCPRWVAAERLSARALAEARRAAIAAT